MGSIWSMGLGAQEIARIIAKGDLTGKVLLAALHKNRFARPRERKVAVSPQESPPIPVTATESGPNGHAVGPTLYIEGIALSDLCYNHCRWPIGDPQEATFHFCGEQKGDKSRYCDAHHAIAYRPVEPIDWEE